MQYLAFIRGINVGGKNPVRMPALKECFQEMGFGDVQTYIQSGNVIFSCAQNGVDTLISKIETGLSRAFDFPAMVILVERARLEKIVNKAPDVFGLDPDSYRYDVLFLKENLDPDKEILKY